MTTSQENNDMNTKGLRTRRRVLGLAVGLACGIGATVAPAAWAGQVSASSGSVSFFDFAPAEANTLTVSGGSGGVTFTDSVPITDGDGPGGCAVDGTTATCPGPVTSLSVSLGNGNDTLTDDAALPDATSVSLSGGNGDDAINGGPTRDSISGGAGNDTLDGRGGADFVAGNDGNDTVNGGDGADSLDGDDGAAGNDTLNGGGGADYLDAGGGDDVLNGDGGDDTLNAGPGNDAYNGGAGDDALPFGPSDPGNDDYVGGPGVDRISWSGATTPVSLTGDDAANDGTVPAAPAPADNANNVHGDIEGLSGGSADDTIVGGGVDNSIDGGAGNDALAGGGGHDSISGGAGDDSVSGGDASDILDGDNGHDSVNGDGGDDVLRSDDGVGDTLNGGDGSDTVDYSGSDSVTVSLDGAPNDGMFGEGDNALAIENIIGSYSDDLLSGSAGRNVITAGYGNDEVNVAGDTGAIDTVICGGGNDMVTKDADDFAPETGEGRCETVNGTGSTSSPAAVPVDKQVPTPTPLNDATPPKITAKLTKCGGNGKIRTFGSRGCLVQVKTNESVRLHITMAAAFKSVTLAATRGRVFLADRDISFSRGTNSTINTIVRPDRKLLKKTPKRLAITVTVEAFDHGGNKVTKTLKATLKQ